MASARDNILNRLRQRQAVEAPAASDFSVVARKQWTREEQLQRFQHCMESVHTEVHRVAQGQWVERLQALLAEKGVGNLLIPREHALGRQVQAAWAGRDGLPELLFYEREIEDWKEELFTQVQASLTSTRAGIAETGSLILWPTPDEPRLMSLVPPIHFAVLEADKLYNTFYEAVQQEGWAQGMPTNALLISGPSKTADIEQTLAYGVHGPKELVVLLVE